MLNVDHLLQSGGLIIIGLIVFAESGVLAGFMLPGDTLLFAAGFLAAQHKLPLGWVIIVAFVAAVIGDNVGYEIGKRLGPRFFRKPNGRFFKQSHVVKAEVFYEKHGGKTVIFARFVPYGRTMVPVLAGVSKMPHKRFTLFNIVGAAFWACGITLLGFWLGDKIHGSIDHYILPVVAIMILGLFGPIVFQLIRTWKASKNVPSS